MKERFFGVNEIHTFMVSEQDPNNVYVGMEVQGTHKSEPNSHILIFSPEQIMELYDTLINHYIKKSEQ